MLGVGAGIDQPGQCLLNNCFQTNPPASMMENGARCGTEQTNASAEAIKPDQGWSG